MGTPKASQRSKKEEVRQRAEVVLARVSGASLPQALQGLIDESAKIGKHVSRMACGDKGAVKFVGDGASRLPGIGRALSHQPFQAMLAIAGEVGIHGLSRQAGCLHDLTDGPPTLPRRKAVVRGRFDLPENGQGVLRLRRRRDTRHVRDI
jgi:hypothetical protein